MKQATIRSVCECQSKLEAILDENRYVLVGFAIGSDNERELAPAHPGEELLHHGGRTRQAAGIPESLQAPQHFTRRGAASRPGSFRDTS